LDQFARTAALLGQKGLKKLAESKVVVFGVGGVGSFAVEALARCGVGKLVLIDHDIVCETNINRQLEALHSTLGRTKVEVLRERVLDINPRAEVIIFKEFVRSDNAGDFYDKDVSYIVDAIDTVSAKLVIIEKAFSMQMPIVSAMGAGNRLDPTKLKIVDISETAGCPLARIMRRELRKRGITHGLKVVYSTEPALKISYGPGIGNKERINGSVSFVPSVAGLFLAAQVVRDLLGIPGES